MWYVIGLIWLALIAGIVWVYRQRRDKHAAARAKQLETLLSDAKRNLTSGAGTGVMPEVAAAKVDSAPVPEFVKKQRLLPQADAMLLRFRTGLPDHEIFVNLTLADLIDIAPAASAYDREQKLRRLAQHRLNLVICTKQFSVVAVVVIDGNPTPDAALAAHARFVEACLTATGIRLIRIDPATAPRHHQVRNLVYDAAG